MNILQIKNISVNFLLIIFILVQFKYIQKTFRNYKSLIISQAQDIKNNIFMLQYQHMIKSKDTCIPRNVYQCWISSNKKIPKCIKESVSIIQKQNKNLNFYFFNDKMCKEFIKKHFDKEVLNAYNTLIPGAYKADLWRYCVMYIKGGIYLDCKYIMHNNNKLYKLLNNEYYVRDISRYHNGEYISQGLIVCRPKNILFKKCIEKIVQNVKSKNIGRCDLDVTGPRLLADKVKENMEYLVNRGTFDIINLKNMGNGNISYKNKLFIKIHKKKDYYSNINLYGKIYPNIYKITKVKR